MARTPLLRLIRALLQEAAAQPHPENSLLPDINRRQLLKLGAGAAGVLAAGRWLSGPAYAKPLSATERVAIIGGGLSGLTIAYRLTRAGHAPMLFEAGNRLGGRVFTRYNVNADGMFCELGGEFVDTPHKDLRALCKELNVPLQSLMNEETGKELYYFNKKYHQAWELINEDGKGAFVALAARIAKDQVGLEENWEWTEKARQLDAMSLRVYLDTMRHLAPAWVMHLLEVAYTVEYGLETDQQSALNLILLLGTGTRKPFSVFGASDEAWRIKGGSSRLPEALARTLEGKAQVRQNHALARLKRNGAAVVCTFDTGHGPLDAMFDRVILTLPFTALRRVEGLGTLGLSPLKLKAIHELGYGTNGKVILGTKEKRWRRSAALPARSSGSFYTDLGIQCVWEASRGQPGRQGILINYLGGDAGMQAPKERMEEAVGALEIMVPGIGKTWDEGLRTHFFWAAHPRTHGSYACPMPGQYTTLLPVAGTPEMDGMLLFAGEHTSAEFTGYMNGAVQSANQVARSLLAA